MNTFSPKIESMLADYDWLRRLAGQLVADPDRADDLAQDTVVATLRDGHRVRGRTRSWLAQVARHGAARQTRTERRRGHCETTRVGIEQAGAESPAATSLRRNCGCTVTTSSPQRDST